MKNNRLRRLLAVWMMIVLLCTAAACRKNSDANREKSAGSAPGMAQEGPNDVAAAALALPQEKPTSECKAEHYQMDLTLDPASHSLTGQAIVDVKNCSDNSLDALCFRFFAAVISPRSKVTAAKNAETAAAYTLEDGEERSVLYLNFGGDALAPGKSLSVQLDFVVAVPELDDRFGYHVSKDGVIYNLTFCFPQLSFLQNGVWDTDPYYDAGETTFNEMADYDVTFRAPETFRVASSGKSKTENGVTVIKAAQVREMAITACDFAEEKTQTVNGVCYRLLAPTYDYGDDEYRAALYDMILETAISSAAYFTEKIGPYLYDELDIIPVPLAGSGGMEMPGLIYIGVCADLQDNFGDAPGCDDLAFVFDTVAHETAHEWFYCAVGDDQYDEAWLDEAFATFCAADYIRNGGDAADTLNALAKKYNRKKHAAQTYWKDMYSEKPPETVYINLTCGDYIDAATYTLAVYDRGYAFLYSLWEEMGDEAFFEMLADWYRENSGAVVKGRHFVAKVLEYDDGDAVKRCLNAYLSDAHL